MLCLSADYEITYLANTEISFILDNDLVVDEFRYEDSGEFEPMLVNEDSLRDALEEVSVPVALPGDLRVVGMSKPGSDDRVFGVVDFSGLT